VNVDVRVETPVSVTPRARQLSGMFDVPLGEMHERTWRADIALPAAWNVGLVVGPSGAGKSTIARACWGEEPAMQWGAASVVDDFGAGLSVEEIADTCRAVGFNTIPAWLRPYGVLSTGERFRVELARRLLEADPAAPVVVDEFTSVVDRQVAQIGAFAVQKWVRRHKRQFVAVTCHYDVMEWLRPDWVLEPATMDYRSEEVQPGRPPIEITVARVAYDAWRVFAPFHYLTAELHRAARCFCLFAGGEPAAFAGILHRPISQRGPAVPVWGVSRLVTLPDWQGLGLAFVLADRLGAAYKAAGLRLHTYPAHPSLIHGFDRSPRWRLVRKPGLSSPGTVLNFGGRPNAVFAYAGRAEAWDAVGAAA
jgi:ABC-type thiamine transport system ATPase subunit